MNKLAFIIVEAVTSQTTFSACHMKFDVRIKSQNTHNIRGPWLNTMYVQ